jgi:hypothetical protein
MKGERRRKLAALFMSGAVSGVWRARYGADVVVQVISRSGDDHFVGQQEPCLCPLMTHYVLYFGCHCSLANQI